MCTSYLLIDASTDQGYEEEGGYYEEEAEENFNHYSAQGKLTLARYSTLANLTNQVDLCKQILACEHANYMP